MCRKLVYLVSLVLFLGASVDIASADISSGLVSYWKLDDGSGTIATDSAGGNDGTLKGDAKWAEGWVVGAVELDGDDDYVDCGQGAIFNTVCRDVITLAAWVRVNPDAGPDWGGIIIRGYGYLFGNVDPYDTFAMYYHRPNARMGFKTNSTSPEWLPSPDGSAADLFNGEWHHVASVYDGATKVIYLDGVEIVRAAATGRIGIGEGTGRVLLGGGRDAEPMVIEFGGLIDEARIYDRALTQEEIAAVMQNVESLPYAGSPNPPVGTLHTATWANLTWRAGDFAVSHDVYVGDDFAEVSDATVDSPAFRGNQAGTTILVGFPGYPFSEGLVPGTTYYWRIDEVNDADPNSPWKGPVWSFSIPPKTAYDPDPADGAEFVDPETIFTWTGGYGSKLHTVYVGESFEEVDSATGGALTGAASYDPGTLAAEKVIYWRVDEFDGVETHKGDVWSFTTPGAVGNPQPANGAADVQMIATLSWTPADNAASHELYFGTDADVVRNATKVSPEYIGPRALGSESYGPGGLAWDSGYAWRVDEVYPAGTVKGPVWTFTTADFLLVDDFESYDDIDPAPGQPGANRIFDKWIDGFGTTTNGALVGNDLPPYAEQGIVHTGVQSMVYRYDNAGKTSEATLTLVYPRDWTRDGVTKLSLWFRGASANAADRLFVALNGASVVYHDDASATQATGWNQWVIDLTRFAGVNLSNVNSITIGIGAKNSPAAGGAGTMYFDDIRLVR